MKYEYKYSRLYLAKPKRAKCNCGTKHTTRPDSGVRLFNYTNYEMVRKFKEA